MNDRDKDKTVDRLSQTVSSGPTSLHSSGERVEIPSSDEDAGSVPRAIAGYRVIRKLGEGGMGVVYEAEQEDPKRPVALKVIRGGVHVDEHAVRLFQREVQTLARLKHPGIAAIHAAGRTEDGQRFFAMELVQGTPLNEFLASRPLTAHDLRGQIERRLTLFLEICQAINYAHQRGVIHRDLKPSNIMVLAEADGVALSVSMRDVAPIKVLDFGLARITDTEADGATVLTQTGQIQGSIPYMSPEQAKGVTDEIDLRSDVYSLGMMLYEFLTDRRPYEVQGLPILEAVRTIVEQPPRKPSALFPLLRGDLETILLKALEKDPARRYQSVLALAEDIERYLSDQPILARPPSAGYQIRKLIARHKGAFASAAALALLLIAFGITMSVMFGIQRRERLRADAERDKAVLESKKSEQINSFLQQMLSSVSPEEALGREVAVREVLDEAADGVETSLAEQPEVRAAVHSTIGLTYMALGQYDLAESHLRAALETRERVLGPEDLEVAGSLNDMAALFWKKGEYDQAQPLFERALEAQREQLGEESSEVATSYNNISLLLRDQGRYAQAESLSRKALAIRENIYGAENVEVALTQTNLAALLQAQGKLPEAEEVCRKALETRRRIFGDRHPDVALSLNNLASILQAEGKNVEAEPLMREALATGRSILGEEHPSIAGALSNLALLLSQEGKNSEAEGLYREVLGIYRKQFGPEHPAVASALNNLACELQIQGEYPEAEGLYRQTLAIRQKVLGKEHPAVATSLNNLAVILQDEGNLSGAEPLYRQSLAMRRKLLGPDHPHVANSLLGLGGLLLERNDARGAEPLLRKCLSIRRRARSIDPTQLALAGNMLGGAIVRQGRYAEAESLLTASTPTIVSAPGVSIKRKREALARVISLYNGWGKPDRAAPFRAQLRDLDK